MSVFHSPVMALLATFALFSVIAILNQALLLEKERRLRIEERHKRSRKEKRRDAELFRLMEVCRDIRTMKQNYRGVILSLSYFMEGKVHVSVRDGNNVLVDYPPRIEKCDSLLYAFGENEDIEVIFSSDQSITGESMLAFQMFAEAFVDWAISARDSKTDALTSLFNFGELTARLEAEIERAVRGKEQLSLAIFDIDNFKTVNDTLGHNVGNRVLERVARIIDDVPHRRKSDIRGRWGGDEFVIILPDTTERGAVEVLERIREEIEATEFPELEGLKLSISVGVATFIPHRDQALGQDPLKTTHFHERADQALLASKANGRNRTSVWRAHGPISVERLP